MQPVQGPCRGLAQPINRTYQIIRGSGHRPRAHREASDSTAADLVLKLKQGHGSIHVFGVEHTELTPHVGELWWSSLRHILH